jgi:hypothetical protein
MSLSAPSFSVGGGVPLTLTVANTGTVYALDNHVTASTGTRFDGMLVLAGGHVQRIGAVVRPARDLPAVSRHGRRRRRFGVDHPGLGDNGSAPDHRRLRADGTPPEIAGFHGPSADSRRAYSMTASITRFAWWRVLAAATSRAPSPIREVRIAA